MVHEGALGQPHELVPDLRWCAVIVSKRLSSVPSIARSGYLNLGTEDEKVIVPPRYPVEFRHKVLDVVEAGRPVVEIAEQLGASDQRIYSWRKRERIDRGLVAGVMTAESR
jgi:hypothetical protein